MQYIREFETYARNVQVQNLIFRQNQFKRKEEIKEVKVLKELVEQKDEMNSKLNQDLSTLREVNKEYPIGNLNVFLENLKRRD